MSTASQINRITQNISNAYDAAEELGAEIPASKTSANLAAAISSIPAGSGTTDYEALSSKPKINSVELSGDKSFLELSLRSGMYSRSVRVIGTYDGDYIYEVTLPFTLPTVATNGTFASATIANLVNIHEGSPITLKQIIGSEGGFTMGSGNSFPFPAISSLGSGLAAGWLISPSGDISVYHNLTGWSGATGLLTLRYTINEG